VEPDDHHIALPKLYGAPAYARPPRTYDIEDRPPDLDDLPLEAYRAEDGGDGIEALGGQAPSVVPTLDPEPRLEPRPFSVQRLRRFLARD
jgi:hypothetical protein